jgi:RHS repeat-associated protein
MRALVERDADTTDGTNSINERRYLYYNAAWQIVEEHVDAGFASASDPVSIDRIVQNIWGLRYIDDLVLRRVDANYPGSGPPSFAETASGDIDWEQYLTDHQFSVVAAVGRTGTLAFRVAYDAFGEARHLPAKDINGDGKVDKTDTTLAQNASGKTLGQPGYNPDADWNRDGKITSADVAQFGSRSYIAALPQGQLAQPGSATQPAATTTTAAANAARAANARSDFNIGFSGYRFNGDIGAYTVRFRHYDPTPGMCRWLERDPAGYQDGPSLYSYLGRNPMAGTDPYGLWFTDWAEDLSFWWHGGKNLSVPQYHQGWRDGKRGRWKHYYVDGEIGATWWIPEYAGGARLSWHDENLNRAAQLERERIDRFQEFRRAGANAVAIGAASVVVAGMTLTPGPEEVIAGAILTRVGVGARVGLVASDGLVIRGFTKHGIDRVVGDGAKRAGVNPRAILDALKSPVRVVEQIDERGRLSRKYAGANATVVVNPATGQIITVYPTNTTGTHYP